ncbi:TfoX/Sxy family DNA transformation protein [Vibrio lentus]
MLRKAGIDSVECLYRVGAASAFLAIRASHLMFPLNLNCFGF